MCIFVEEVLINKMIHKKERDFLYENFEFRLKASPQLTKKVLDKMKTKFIRKRSEIVCSLLLEWVSKND